MTDEKAQPSIVIVGAGYGGLHVAQRLSSWLNQHPAVDLTLIDRHDYHQLIVEWPRVATGSRVEEMVRIPLDDLLVRRVKFMQATVTGFDLKHNIVRTDQGPISYTFLVLAMGSEPNDFGIPGMAEYALHLYSGSGAQQMWEAVQTAVKTAAQVSDPQERKRLLTVLIGGGGATGVELAGGFAEELPELARRHGLPPDLCRVMLIEAGPTILAGSSPQLIRKAGDILRQLHVEVRINATVAAAIPNGFKLKNDEIITGGVVIWAGGVKAPALLQNSDLPIGSSGRVKVDQYLRAMDYPNVFIAGDLAAVVDPETGHALPVLAQIAVEEGETVAYNLQAVLENRSLKTFTFKNKGFVVSVGDRSGVAEVLGRTFGGRLASALKDAIEWEYRQSVKYLQGRGAV